MVYTTKKKSYSVVLIVCVFICLCVGTAFHVECRKRLDDTRRQLDTAREQLTDARAINSALTEQLESANNRLEQCHYLLEDIGATTGRNVSTIRECIEVLEETRYYLGCLSYYIDGCDSNELYSRLDGWLKSEGAMK